MNLLELTGILLRELSLKTDKNGNDYYLGKLNCNDGAQYVFFFFRPDYNLTLRLTELQVNQELTLQGQWSKRGPTAFLATNFYLAEIRQDNQELEDNNWFEF